MSQELTLHGIGIEEVYSTIRSIFRQELDARPAPVAVSASSDESLTLNQACALLNVGLTAVHHLKKTRQLPYWKVGRRVFVKKSHCLAILAGEKVRQEL